MVLLQSELISVFILPEQNSHWRRSTKSELKWKQSFCRRSIGGTCTFLCMTIGHEQAAVFGGIWTGQKNSHWTWLLACLPVHLFQHQYGQLEQWQQQNVEELAVDQQGLPCLTKAETIAFGIRWLRRNRSKRNSEKTMVAKILLHSYGCMIQICWSGSKIHGKAEIIATKQFHGCGSETSCTTNNCLRTSMGITLPCAKCNMNLGTVWRHTLAHLNKEHVSVLDRFNYSFICKPWLHNHKVLKHFKSMLYTKAVIA